MKVILTLKDWENQNVAGNWNAIISILPPRYRGGYNHKTINRALTEGGSLSIDFGDSEEVAKNFLATIAVQCTNTFYFGTEK